MNPYFLPNEKEQQLILKVQKYCRNEFALIRMTDTMIQKSIIDASDGIRQVLKDRGYFDYSTIKQGDKEIKDAHTITEWEVRESKVSLYRPKTKQGDPRFWIYGLGNSVDAGVLMYFTVSKEELIAIPLTEYPDFEYNLVEYFGQNTDRLIIEELVGKLTAIKHRGWIESVSPYVSNPKDVGDTLETILGIPANCLVSADYKGEIELKAKRMHAGTKDSLFSMVPDWEISRFKSATDIMLEFGYPSTKEKYQDFIDLYVTVGNKPNNQGLYMGVDEEQQLVYQNSYRPGKVEEVCNWRYTPLRQRLLEKHPKTMWVVAEEQKIDGRIHFMYQSVQLTQRPIFSQFLTLVSQGIVTYDWRGRVKPDRTKYKDKGHCFRMHPKNRLFLFGDVEEVVF